MERPIDSFYDMYCKQCEDKDICGMRREDKVDCAIIIMSLDTNALSSNVHSISVKIGKILSKFK